MVAPMRTSRGEATMVAIGNEVGEKRCLLIAVDCGVDSGKRMWCLDRSKLELESFLNYFILLINFFKHFSIF